MSKTQSPIAILGGSGSVGTALARNLLQHGYSVRLAGRDGNATQELVKQLGARAAAVPLAEVAAGAELVLLAVPAAAAVSALEQAGDLSGKLVVDCTNPLTWDAGPVHAPPPGGSVTAMLAARFPAVRFVKAFNTFGAEFHADARLAGANVDVYIAGDDAPGKQQVAELATTLGFSPVDVGPLRNAAHLESLAILWIHLALVGGHGRNVAFKLLPR